MLRYDAAWLIEWYYRETVAAPGIPYAKLAGRGPFRIQREPGEFQLTQVVDVNPRLDYDETIVRLARFENGTLWVQPCAYSDGVKSNYAMDGPGELRETLRTQYGGQLPPLSDTRLSNGIGTTVVVTQGDGRPYLPRRAPRQSVFPGGYHCTASGEAVWREPEAAITGDRSLMAAALQADPSRVDPGRVDPTLVDPTLVDPRPVDPTRVDPSRVNPTRVNPGRVDPTRVNPTRVDPTRVDPSRVDPSRVDPSRDRQGAVHRERELSFEALFTANICRELEEEVGIARSDLEWIRPIAFCREFLRAGKPQFFFAAHTKLGAEELAVRRRAAIARQIAAGRQEVMDDALFDTRPELCTLECAANLALAEHASRPFAP